MHAPLLALVVLLSTVGVAGAAVPVDTGSELVGSFGWYSYATQQGCSSWDPVLGLVTTSLTSRLDHAEVDGLTTYTLHLESVATSADAACGSVDLQLVSAMAWPEPGTFAYGTFETACGATGTLYVPAQSQGVDLLVYVLDAPDACGLPFAGSTQLFLETQPLVEGMQACLPVVVMGCSGPHQGESYTGCPQLSDRFAVEVLGIALVQGGHRCDWQTGAEYGYAGDGLGIVTIRGEGGSCSLLVSDPLVGVVSESADCPAELGNAVDGQDWAHVLP